MFRNLALLLTALIWGTDFTAQSVGMDYIGPCAFTAARSFIGGIALLPVIALMDGMRRRSGESPAPEGGRTLVIGGVLCGVALGVASLLQQAGIAAGTSSGKAGFITALYILFVPLLGLLMHKKPRPIIWLCVAMSIFGLYLLCVTDGLGSVRGSDLMVLACAVVFAVHIQIIDRFAPLVDGVRMSCIQFFVCGAIALVLTFIFEKPDFSALLAAWGPVLYAGVMSSGVGYTLQIIGQKYTNPTVASMILSLESVFAVLGGIVILGQMPAAREIVGCCVMFAAIVIAQLPEKKRAA